VTGNAKSIIMEIARTGEMCKPLFWTSREIPEASPIPPPKNHMTSFCHGKKNGRFFLEASRSFDPVPSSRVSTAPDRDLPCLPPASLSRIMGTSAPAERHAALLGWYRGPAGGSAGEPISLFIVESEIMGSGVAGGCSTRGGTRVRRERLVRHAPPLPLSGHKDGHSVNNRERISNQSNSLTSSMSACDA
jgi:hypothetical protein